MMMVMVVKVTSLWYWEEERITRVLPQPSYQAWREWEGGGGRGWRFVCCFVQRVCSLVTRQDSDERNTAHNTTVGHQEDGEGRSWSPAEVSSPEGNKTVILCYYQYHESVTQSFEVCDVWSCCLKLDQNPKNTYQWSSLWRPPGGVPWTWEECWSAACSGGGEDWTGLMTRPDWLFLRLRPIFIGEIRGFDSENCLPLIGRHLLTD